MFAYPYKAQVKVIIASMTLHNYIRKKSQEDVAFIEYNHNPNFIRYDIFVDIFPYSQNQGNSTLS
jgi:hypothetical protein